MSIFVNIDKISLNPFFFAVLAFFVFIDGTAYMLLILSAALIHEGAHVLSFLCFKARIKELRFLPFGIKIDLSQDTKLSYNQEIISALSGPIINLLLAIGTLILGQIIKDPNGFGFFFVCNLALFFLNILPITPLDGGRALYYLLIKKYDIIKAEKISSFISATLIIPMLLFGIYVLYITKFNFTLILIAIYLLICLYKKIR